MVKWVPENTWLHAQTAKTGRFTQKPAEQGKNTLKSGFLAIFGGFSTFRGGFRPALGKPGRFFGLKMCLNFQMSPRECVVICAEAKNHAVYAKTAPSGLIC